MALASALERRRSIRQATRMAVEGRIGRVAAWGIIGASTSAISKRSNLAVQAKVALVCNIPFEVSIQSANGGLANSEFRRAGALRGSRRLQLSVAVPVVRPEAGVVSRPSPAELRAAMPVQRPAASPSTA
jgi:hypothetical protein